MSYFKLDHNIFTSSIWTNLTPAQFKLWTYLMGNAHPATGIVSDTIPGMCARAVLPRDEVEEALRVFQEPDPDSRSSENEGRRIRKIEGGWQLLNYRRYADKDHSTNRVQRFRERQKIKQGDGVRPEEAKNE